MPRRPAAVPTPDKAPPLGDPPVAIPGKALAGVPHCGADAGLGPALDAARWSSDPDTRWSSDPDKSQSPGRLVGIKSCGAPKYGGPDREGGSGHGADRRREYGSAGGGGSRRDARLSRGTGSSGQGRRDGSGRGADVGCGNGLGRGATHGSVSGPEGDPLRELGRSAGSGSGRGGVPDAAACLFISQRMTVIAAAAAVAAAIVTNPPATHCVALTASPVRDASALCSCIRPAVSAPTR